MVVARLKIKENSVIKIEDYIQIKNLVYRYAYLLDTGRWADLGELFADADVYIAGALAVRRNAGELTALWQRYVRLYDTKTPRTHHIITNLTIEGEARNIARAHSYVLVVQQTKMLPLQPIITGDYLDRFVNVGGIWRFSERRIDNDLFGDLSAHLLLEMETSEDKCLQRY